jgi:hypothetical protein
MKKFLALYRIPAKVVEEWSKNDLNTRKVAEEKIREEWIKWMSDHATMVTSTEVAGKTKRASADGISDVKNDVMLYSIVEADSHEIAARLSKTIHTCRFPSPP